LGLVTKIIRVPHGRRHGEVRVIKNEKGKLKTLLLVSMPICMVGPAVASIVFTVITLFGFADYPVGDVLFVCGTAAMAFAGQDPV
jgi:hypothetical protein